MLPTGTSSDCYDIWLLLIKYIKDRPVVSRHITSCLRVSPYRTDVGFCPHKLTQGQHPLNEHPGRPATVANLHLLWFSYRVDCFAVSVFFIWIWIIFWPTLHGVKRSLFSSHCRPLSLCQNIVVALYPMSVHRKIQE